MAAHISDRWLWLGVSVFFFAAVKGIHYALTDLVRLTELDAEQFSPKDREVKKQPEDAISLSTLRTLVRSPNPSISAAAQSLVIKRFASLPDAAEILRRNIESPNERTKRLARQAIQYLYEWDLELRDSLPIDPSEQAEDGQDWQNYPELDEVFDALAAEGYHTEGSDGEDTRELPGSGLVARLEELSEEVNRTERDFDSLRNGVGQARFAGWDRIPLQRPPLRGEEDEAERRRRRREVMVFHEGSARVQERDIFRPNRG